jgi:hypothetical protein
MQVKLIHRETKKGNYRIYKVSEPIKKGISDLFGETTIDKIIESNKDRVSGKFRVIMLERLGKGVEYVTISDALTHIERLAFPTFDTGEPGERLPHGHPYVPLCFEIEGKRTEMISGGDARKVYPDLVYLRRLAQINGYKWEGEEE